VSTFWGELQWLRPTGTIEVYRGKNVQGYTLLDSEEKMSLKQATQIFEKHEALKRPKIMAQEIIAHILHPRPHLRFIGAYDAQGVLSVNTVSNIFTLNPDIGKFPLKLFLGILNSTVCSWFADRLLYCNATRTMHLGDYQLAVLRMVPKKRWKGETAKAIVRRVDERIDIGPPSSEVELKDITKYAKILEVQINEMVGRMFGLSKEPIESIDKAMGTKSLIETGRSGKNLASKQQESAIKKATR